MRTLLFLSLSLILFPTSSNAQHNPTSDPKAVLLDSMFHALYQAGQVNGNVLIAEKGQILYENSFGLANEADSIPLNLETMFELASVSKQFTAMGIVQLRKAGKLSLQDDIRDHLPELDHYEGITIQHLLTHTSGLPDYMDLAEEHWDRTRIATNEDIIALFQEHQPEIEFEPNSSWAYSNTGYLLLGSIMERVSGQSFGDYLSETIFEPLEMDRTIVYRRRYQPEDIDNYADGYLYSPVSEQKFIPDELGPQFYVVYLDGIVGDGMVNSTLHDLLKWDRALHGNSLVTDEEKELIFASYPIDSGEETDYGFGWGISETDEYQTVVSHSGGWAGYITYIERHLDTDKTIIMLQNNSTPETEIPIKHTRRILYGQPLESAVVLEVAILERYAGTYVSESGKERELSIEDGKLWLPMNEEVNLELVPVSEVKFIVDGFSPEVTLTFRLNAEEEPTGYRLQQQETGVDQIVVRKEE